MLCKHFVEETGKEIHEVRVVLEFNVLDSLVEVQVHRGSAYDVPCVIFERGKLAMVPGHYNGSGAERFSDVGNDFGFAPLKAEIKKETQGEETVLG
jgi:hypothetical protein